MLAELLEQDHGKKRRPDEAARGDMERRRRLRDRLAFSAREALPDGLDHFPLARDDLQRLGDVFAELRQLGRAAARAGHRRWNDDPLARQMIRKRLAARPLALEGFDRGGAPRPFGGEFVFRRIRLRFLELKLQLIEKPRRALGARPINRAPKLLDFELEKRDQRAVVGGRCSSVGQLGADRRGVRLLRRDFRPRRDQRRFQRFEVVRKGGKISAHESDRITKSDLRRPFL
jgi:hypothetical protein